MSIRIQSEEKNITKIVFFYCNFGCSRKGFLPTLNRDTTNKNYGYKSINEDGSDALLETNLLIDEDGDYNAGSIIYNIKYSNPKDISNYITEDE